MSSQSNVANLPEPLRFGRTPGSRPPGRVLAGAIQGGGCSLRPVALTARDRTGGEAFCGEVDLPRHAALREEIERRVGEINGRFGAPGWVPVHYVHRWLEPAELQAWYQAADVLLVTPLKAGMELVAKEYCAARTKGNGALVLSEFAGAAAQLGSGALLVNPFNVEATSRALYRALRMKPAERAARMSALRAEVQGHDVYWWADSFLAAALREPGHRMPGLRNSL